ncbi:long-chain fatty acid--CoA ligase [Chloroflexota bacterium]
MYIGDYLGRREIYSPDAPAIIDAGKSPQIRLTYSEWNHRVNRLANWLKDSADIKYRDRVAILAQDGIEHLDLFYACGKLGAIHTALNWRLHWRELVAIIQDTQPKVIIYSDVFKDTILEVEKATRDTDYAISQFLHIEGNGIQGSFHYESIIQSSSDKKVTYEALEKEDIACLLFTGGTTGLPKGAQISHRQICWNVLNTVIHDLNHDDIYLCVFPLFHAGGLFAYLSSQVVFGNLTILTKQFDPLQVLDLIEKEKVTVFAAVPTMYQMMAQADNFKKADLSSLRFCTSGGAPLPVPLIEEYTREKGIRFKQGFGMTEYGPGLFALPPEDAIRKAGSIGRPNFFIDVRVVDEDNHPLGPNSAGELLLKGPSGCSGYWNNPEATAEVIDEEGWFHTGDIVEYDQDWYFFVRDRKKDMFISGAENVYPVEIENVLYKLPEIHMCAVIGIPDDKWGEVGKACIVFKPGQSVAERELFTHMEENLARYKVPKSIEILEALPLSSMGKILKRELREKFIA